MSEERFNRVADPADCISWRCGRRLFIAKWLGVRWIVSIERNGGEVGDERVRGWRKSQRRIREIAQSAAAGTLQQESASIRRPTNDDDARTRWRIYNQAESSQISTKLSLRGT
jgi:hypothetical protein